MSIKAISARADKYAFWDAAFGSLDRYAKPMCVMLGDDDRYWVVTQADASRLERAGYEYAN